MLGTRLGLQTADVRREAMDDVRGLGVVNGDFEDRLVDRWAFMSFFTPPNALAKCARPTVRWGP
eukprot:5316880-Prymnesium_polylepis.2